MALFAHLVAPCSPPHHPDDLERGVAWLMARGVSVTRPKLDHVGAPLPHLAGSDAHRAAALRAAFDSGADLVWCVRGGSGALRTLDALGGAGELGALGLDVPLVGLSDVTALHAARFTAGVASIHAPVVTMLPALDAESTQALEAWLRDPRRMPVLETRRAAPRRRPVGRDGVFGRLFAGNLTVLGALCGTPAMPDLRDAILLVEDAGEWPYRVDRTLAQLHASGALRGLAALCYGTFEPTSEREREDAQIAVLDEWAARLGLPLCGPFPVGHGPSSWPSGQGLLYRLDIEAGSLAPLERVREAAT